MNRIIAALYVLAAAIIMALAIAVFTGGLGIPEASAAASGAAPSAIVRLHAGWDSEMDLIAVPSTERFFRFQVDGQSLLVIGRQREWQAALKVLRRDINAALMGTPVPVVGQ